MVKSEKKKVPSQGGGDLPVKPKPKVWDTFREYVVAILVCLVVALFVVTFIVHPMAVPTESMQTPADMKIPGSEETYGKYGLLVGDRLLVDKFSILANQSSLCRLLGLAHPISRGDVVVFKTPDPNHFLTPYVKRVIGLPGEIIELRKGEVYINGRRLVEPYKYPPGGVDSLSPRQDMPPTKIPDVFYVGQFCFKRPCYFVMGDNRNNSADSRYWGPVPEEYIFGKPLMILWSFPDNEVVQTAFPDGRYRGGVHTIQDTGDVLTLYLYRLINFYKTRWSRMFHFVRQGNCYFEPGGQPLN